MPFGPPQIFPPVPINEPGAPGSNAAPVTSPGTGSSFFQPSQPEEVLETGSGEVSFESGIVSSQFTGSPSAALALGTEKDAPLEPITYSPPINFASPNVSVAPAPAPAFNPATLALTLYLNGGNYNAGTGTWTGTPSAGSSGAHNGSSSGTNPIAGAPLNGIQTVSFDGLTEYLLTGLPLSAFITAAAFSGWALINCTGASNYSPDYYNNPCIFCDITQGYFNIGVRRASAVPGPAAFQGVTTNANAEAAMSGSTWQLLQWYYDGIDLWVRTNSGTWTSQASTNVSNVTFDLVIGVNYTGGLFYNGLIASLGLSNIAFSQATFDNIRMGLNAQWGLSL